VPHLIPPRIIPPATPLNRAAFVATFVRNPLACVPQAAYEEDFVPLGENRAWVTSPALIKSVLVDQRDKFRKLQQIRLLSPLLGRGILTSEGAQWKWQRQAAAPMFSPDALASFVPAFVHAAEACVERWAPEDGGVQQIEEEMTRATFDVILATLLPSTDETLPEVVRRNVDEMRRTGGWDLLFAVLSLPAWLPRPGMFSEPRAVAALRGAIATIVASMRKEEGAPTSLTHRLIAARDPETRRAMDDDQLVDNVLTFYLAGHETTAKALTWTLFLLSRSPEWTAALEDEIARVTGGAPIAAEQIDQLVLTRQVIQEAMRLYPPIPIMSRQSVADATLDGREIRAGTSLIMPIYAIHRHARRWEEPDAFMPERFTPSGEASIPRYQYMPFGAGPRVCIGQVFAMMEATAMVATLLQRARFKAVEGYEPTPVARVTLVPKGGMPLRVSVAAGVP
jgi:cytochrome P450